MVAGATAGALRGQDRCGHAPCGCAGRAAGPALWHLSGELPLTLLALLLLSDGMAVLPHLTCTGPQRPEHRNPLPFHHFASPLLHLAGRVSTKYCVNGVIVIDGSR